MDVDRPVIYLKPGEIFFAQEPIKIITVLGSCISVIMHNRIRSAGAICHAVIPFRSKKPPDMHSDNEAFKYVDRSIDWMISRFKEIGIEAGGIEVRIYGGSEILPLNGSHKSIAVGRKNIETAIRIIRNRRMYLKEWSVGGNKGRKIIFYTDIGDVVTNYVGCIIE